MSWSWRRPSCPRMLTSPNTVAFDHKTAERKECSQPLRTPMIGTPLFESSKTWLSVVTRRPWKSVFISSPITSHALLKMLTKKTSTTCLDPVRLPNTNPRSQPLWNYHPLWRHQPVAGQVQSPQTPNGQSRRTTAPGFSCSRQNSKEKNSSNTPSLTHNHEQASRP